MSLQQTSLLAYLDVKTDLNRRQHQVLDAIRTAQPVCNQDIAGLLNWPINAVTPRVLELREKGRVIESHKAAHPVTKRAVMYWRAA